MALRLVVDDEMPHAGHRLEGTEQEQKLRDAIEQLPEEPATGYHAAVLQRHESLLRSPSVARMSAQYGRWDVCDKAMLKLKRN